MNNGAGLPIKITDSVHAWSGRLYRFETKTPCSKTIVSQAIYNRFGTAAGFLDFNPSDQSGVFLLFDQPDEFSRGTDLVL